MLIGRRPGSTALAAQSPAARRSPAGGSAGPGGGRLPDRGAGGRVGRAGRGGRRARARSLARACPASVLRAAPVAAPGSPVPAGRAVLPPAAAVLDCDTGWPE